jgi:hypothetical protein
MSERTFSVDGAEALLPLMETLLRRAMEAKTRVEEIEKQFQAINRNIFLRGGVELDIVPLARLRAESDKGVQQIKDTMAEIESTGAQIKDLDLGLIDFPCAVDGETILLCWKIGEPRITHWHSAEEGFAGRKPINDRIAKAKPTGFTN